IAEFDNDIRRERQQDGINKAKAEGGEVWSQAASDDRSGAEDLGESCLDSKEPQVRAKASDRASAWFTKRSFTIGRRAPTERKFRLSCRRCPPSKPTVDFWKQLTHLCFGLRPPG